MIDGRANETEPQPGDGADKDNGGDTPTGPTEGE